MKVPGRDVAPGPGRLAAKFTRTLDVDGMQNTDASVTDVGVSSVIGPAGEPFSVIVAHAVLPKQPF